MRSIYEGWERGDFTSAEWADPEMELVIADGPAPGSWTGFARIAEVWRDFLSAWEDARVEAEEYRVLDGDRVLVVIYRGGRGKVSGLELTRGPGNRGANLFHIRGGKVTKLIVYFDVEDALADLGPAPETD